MGEWIYAKASIIQDLEILSSFINFTYFWYLRNMASYLCATKFNSAWLTILKEKTSIKLLLPWICNTGHQLFSHAHFPCDLLMWHTPFLISPIPRNAWDIIKSALLQETRIHVPLVRPIQIKRWVIYSMHKLGQWVQQWLFDICTGCLPTSPSPF